MSSVYTYQNAIDDARLFSRNVTVPSATQIRLADIVNNEIWRFAPWRWAKGNLTAISLVDSTQDYTVSDSDFSTLLKCKLRRTDTDPDEWQELDIVDYLSEELNVEVTFRGHRSVAYIKTGGNDRLRLEYSVNLPSGVAVQIEGEYKVEPTSITALSAGLPFEDHYYQTAVNGLIYYIYRFDNDIRAGEMLVDKRSGERRYSGAWGAFIDSLWWMAEQEDAYPQTRFPSDSLGTAGQELPLLFR